MNINPKDNTVNPVDRFWYYVDQSSKHPCWIWTGSISGNYGSMQAFGVRTKAHRFSYSQFVGDIPHGLYVCHSCDNPLCVNPDHLFLGSQRANMQDMVVKGRSNKGSLRPAAKLSEDDVIYIRSHYVRGHKTFGAEAMAKQFGVNYYTIMNILTRSAWRHV